MRRVWLALLLALCVSCGSAEPAVSGADTTRPPEGGAGCADVVGVVVAEDGAGYRFDVTIRSDDTGWDKYADAWEVRAPDGTVLGTRELLHPHEDEQPFTRSLAGVTIPDGIARVTVAARDSELGFCGEVASVDIPGRAST